MWMWLVAATACSSAARAGSPYLTDDPSVPQNPWEINLSATYEPDGGKWRLQVWAKNVMNRWSLPAPSNYNFYFLTPTEAPATEVDRGVINPPRQIGATFTYKFE